MNVRTNHAHLVLTAPGGNPAKVMNSLKSWATRRLREAGMVGDEYRSWSRHGSAVWLFEEREFTTLSGLKHHLASRMVQHRSQIVREWADQAAL